MNEKSTMEIQLIKACQNRNGPLMSQILSSPWGIRFRSSFSNTVNTFRCPGTSYNLMHVACYSDNPTFVSMLFQCGANVHLANEDNLAPLHVASGYGTRQVVSLLLCLGADVNAVDNSGRTPLHYAVVFGNLDAVTTLLNQKLAMLQEKPVDVNCRTHEGFTPLHIAATIGCTEIAQELLDRGAQVNVNEFHVGGMTPLHHACYMGHEECVRLLLDAGADATLTDKRQMNARMTALERGHRRIVDLLPIEQGHTLGSLDVNEMHSVIGA